MKVLTMEGVANHVDPESCVDVRKGIGEALTGADAGRAIEPPKYRVRKADTVSMVGRQYGAARFRKSVSASGWSKNLSTYRSRLRGNREIPGLAGVVCQSAP